MGLLKQLKAVFAERRAEKQRKADRQQMAARILAQKRQSHSCIHRHATGDTHCVLVEQSTPGQPDLVYILCQRCQGKIAPGPTPANPNYGFIYDSALYNRLAQRLPVQVACDPHAAWHWPVWDEQAEAAAYEAVAKQEKESNAPTQDIQ